MTPLRDTTGCTPWPPTATPAAAETTVVAECRRNGWVALVLVLTLGTPLIAQDPGRIAVESGALGTVQDRFDGFTPRYGPPGTVVTLNVSDMPVEASLRLGVGAMRFGFEEVGWVLSDAEGRFTQTIVIPQWARNDLPHVFIVFNPYFVPLAISEGFDVTDADGVVRRTGRISRLGPAGCVTLLGGTGFGYTLVGSAALPGSGDSVTVEGILSRRPACAYPTAIVVQRVERHPQTRSVYR